MFLKILVIITLLFSFVYGDEEDKLIETEGKRFGVLEPENPIFWFRLAEKNGVYDLKRVTEVFAIIKTRYLTANGRINFPTTGDIEDRFQKSKAPGDERGHLVPAQFSGPKMWYNLSPQNIRVNRNESYPALTKEWANAECEVQKFLYLGDLRDRSVTWWVKITYPGYSNRPSFYDLTVQFNQYKFFAMRDDLSIRVYNPFWEEDNTLYACEKCKSARFNSKKSKKQKKPVVDTCQPLS